MIVGVIISSVDDGKTHCEYYDEEFTRYLEVREKVK